MLKELRAELPATIKLAIPIIITQMGQMLLGLVDIFMVGKLGPEAIGSVAVGTALFFVVCVFGMCLLNSLDYFISKSRGENNTQEIHIWKAQGFYFSLLISVPLILISLVLSNNLTFFGIPASTAVMTHSFLNIYTLSLLPFLVFSANRQYLQSVGFAQVVTVVSILANILNFFLNWLLISGNLGMPAMGIRGSAVSTLVTRTLMAAVLFYFTFRNDPSPFDKIRWSYLKNLARLGFPAGLTGIFEVAIFSLSTAFASQLDPLSLAAHSVVLNIASFTFMVPLGISFAAAIRVGYFLGEKDYGKSRSVGNGALFLGAGFMAFSGLMMFLTGSHLIGIFTDNSQVIEIALKIIILAAIFQVADGVQVVSTGALRGLGNTKISAMANLLSYWFVALPVSYYLCFKTSLGIVGLWMGLTLGLALVASILLVFWRKLSLRIQLI